MFTSNLKTDDRTYYSWLVLCGIILIIPLIDIQIIPGHDYIFHVSRIEDVAEALKYGIFPVRMYVDPVQFWGAPVGIFYPSLFNYIPALLKLTGLPIEICYNTYIALIFYLGLFASWHGFSLLTRSKNVGLFSAVLYVSSGYYLLDAYIRNALGELLALSFMPLAIACILQIINKPKVRFKIYLLTIISASAIIESHVLSSLFLFLFAIVYIMFKLKKMTFTKCRQIVFLATAVFLLNASFIIPFLVFYEKVPLDVHFINEFSQSGLHPVFILRFLIFWNFWVFTGFYILLSTRIHLSSSFSSFKKKYFNHYSIYFLAGLFFLYASSSIFPWEYLPPLKNLLKFMQFSWRFLGFATLLLCVCSGLGMYFLLIHTTKRFYYMFAVLLICLTNLIAFTYLTPTPFYNMFEKCYWERTAFYSDQDYLYKDTDVQLLFNQNDHYITTAKIYNWNKKLTDISFSYSTDTNADIILPLMNYPGYIAENENGEKIELRENGNHMITLPLSKGMGEIRVYYEGLPVFKIADYISLLSLSVLVFVTFLCYKRRMSNRLL